MRVPAGSVINPYPPAAVAARGLTGFLFGALAKVAPDRVPACESGGDTGITSGGYDDQRRPFVFLEFLHGSWGGRPDRDGVELLIGQRQRLGLQGGKDTYEMLVNEMLLP